MATALIYSKTGTKHDSSKTLEAKVFDATPSHELVGQAYRTYLANGRVSGASTLKRGAVRGGGKKPWRQKGTGRARVGSIRVPNWRGGGVVFGPTGNENHSINLPVHMKRLALRQALSLRASAGDIIVLDAFESPEGKVRPTLELLGKLGIEGTALLAVSAKTHLIDRATRNIAGLKTVGATYLNVYDVMNADKLILTTDALDAINGWLGDK